MRNPKRGGIYDKLDKLKASPWLQDVFDKLIYEEIREAVLNVTRPSRYDPLLYERHLSDVSRLLDRCLAYRRECADLERQAINRALEYQLFTDMKEYSEELTSQLTATLPLERTRDGQAATGNALQAVKNELKALSPAYIGGADSSQAAIEIQSAKKRTLDSILDLQTKYQKDLQLRHETPGHALNYAERRNRVVSLLKQDVAEAYEKALAACAGLQAQLAVSASKYPFPVPHEETQKDKDIDLLDNFVMWTRDVLAEFERYLSDETTFDLVIPLVQPYGLPDAVSKGFFYEKNAFMDLLASKADTAGRFSIDLSNAIPIGISGADHHVRLRGIGISASLVEPINQTLSWSAVIFLPPQPHPTAAFSKRKILRIDNAPTQLRPPIVLGRILPYSDGVNPVMNFGDEVWNAVLTGGTVIYLQPIVLNGSSDAPPDRGRATLNDLKVHVKIAAKTGFNPEDFRKKTLIRNAKRRVSGPRPSTRKK